MSEGTPSPLRLARFEAPCARLEDPVDLPLRIGIFDTQSAESRRPLGRRVAELLDQLAVGAGVDLYDGTLDLGAPRAVDLAIVRGPLPADAVGLDAWLRGSGVRVWLVDHPSWLDPAAGMVARGAPPAVVVGPCDDARRDAFIVDLIERLLHDVPLVRAAERAAIEAQVAVDLLLPAGRRPGFDLGRRLEQQRQELDDLRSSLRAWEMELTAASGQLDPDVAVALQASRKALLGEAVAVAEACEEIDRDRDPAAWSRLSGCVDRTRAVHARLVADRAAAGRDGG